jgi:hypothetical protein
VKRLSHSHQVGTVSGHLGHLLRGSYKIFQVWALDGVLYLCLACVYADDLLEALGQLHRHLPRPCPNIQGESFLITCCKSIDRAVKGRGVRGPEGGIGGSLSLEQTSMPTEVHVLLGCGRIGVAAGDRVGRVMICMACQPAGRGQSVMFHNELVCDHAASRHLARPMILGKYSISRLGSL